MDFIIFTEKIGERAATAQAVEITKQVARQLEDNSPKISRHLDGRYRQRLAGVVILIVSELENVGSQGRMAVVVRAMMSVLGR